MADKHYFKVTVFPFILVTQRHICEFFQTANYSGSIVPYGSDGTHNLEKKQQPRHSPSGWYNLENQTLLVDPEFSHTDSPGPSPRGDNCLPQTVCVFIPVKISLES